MENNHENEKGKHRRKVKTVLVQIACVFAAFIFVIAPVTAVIVYNDCFGKRFETSAAAAHSINDFEGLRVEECSFPSNDGQMLAGYQYSRTDQRSVKGVVVLAHGLGGGQNAYMDVADCFTSNGYLVFAYDATGNDKSEGASVEGLPQGIIDLDYALRYVKQAEPYKALPILLFGHSWGGYSVGNVLNCHPDINAAVIVSGFDRSYDLIESQGGSMIGPFIKVFMPYFSLYERLKFGKYASYNALDGFGASDAGIMIVHSRDDAEVPIEYGYDKFYAAFSDDARFCFVEYADRGHNILLDDTLTEQILEFFDAYCDSAPQEGS